MKCIESNKVKNSEYELVINSMYSRVYWHKGENEECKERMIESNRIHELSRIQNRYVVDVKELCATL